MALYPERQNFSGLSREMMSVPDSGKHDRADGGVWRIAFAFDPARAAILLVGGDKSGVASGRFYKGLIKRADARFDQHLESLT